MTGLVLDRRQLLLSGAAVAVAASTSAHAHNGTVHVTIEQLAYVPAEIKVKIGETIEWINKDPIEHTATVRGGWEVIIPADAKASKVVEVGDDVEYYCRLHPNMTGRIIITG
ncbi:MAG TPA: cupredoxin domain-containing protein [Hyphomicrobiaceae bacterium]|nr:cupredoxin domain-containing protein [Hyphomicrobiaceae bacterium]